MTNALSIDDNHWLLPAPEGNIVTPFQSGELNPKYIVLHSHGKYRTIEWAIWDWTEIEDTKESMHLAIKHDGSYIQFAGFKTKVWHCGASYYQGHHGLNNWAIGICLEDPVEQTYSDAQFATLDTIIPLIVQKYNIRDIVGHMEVSDDQSDPGYEFPLDRYRPYTRYGNADAAGRYAVSIPNILSSDGKTMIRLNVRGGPDVRFEVIDNLNAGDTVKVIRRAGGPMGDSWAQVVYDDKRSGSNRHGWVHESFLKRL